MPFGDRTGPLGTGPMTGRGAGFCGGYGAPGWVTSPWGGGFPGGGRGGRRGWRNWFYATGLTGWQRGRGAFAGSPWAGGTSFGPLPADEAGLLKGQAKNLERTLAAIRKRIEQLEEKDKAE